MKIIPAGARNLIAYCLFGAALFCCAASLNALTSKPATAASCSGGCNFQTRCGGGCFCDLTLGNGIDSGFCAPK